MFYIWKSLVYNKSVATHETGGGLYPPPRKDE